MRVIVRHLVNTWFVHPGCALEVLFVSALKDPVLTIRHCARDFVLVLTEARQPSFRRSSESTEIFVVHQCFLRVKFFGKTCGMEKSISISELSAENGVVVLNAYRLIIGDNEDHVNDTTTEVCWYLYVTSVEISSLRFGIRKADLTCFVC